MNMRLGGAITALPYQAVASAWHDLQVGGGGNVVGLDINPTDGTFLHWGDVFGGYVSNTANAGSNGNWQPAITAASMPSVQIARTGFTGVWAMASSPHNPNTIVMSYNGNVNSGGSSGVMISRNKGATWTAITAITTTFGRAGRYTGTIVFNPTDDSEFYVGLPGSGGLWHCTSYGSSATRLDPATIPSPTGSSEASFQGMAWVGSTILIGSYGNGVYISTNGGSTWALDSGSPTKPFSGGMAADGVTYFCLNDTGTGAQGDVYRRSSGGTWTNILSGQTVNGLAIDPNNKDHIAVIQFNGNTNVSTNATGSATWAGFNGSWTISSGDTPWMGWSFNSSFTFMDANSCYFDGSGRFWVAMGIGVIYTTSLSGTVNYIPMSQGDEGLVGNWARWVPNGGPALLAAWDRPLWVVTNPNATQSTHAPNPDTTGVTYSDAIDYAQNNNSFYVGTKAGDIYYSSDTGVTWTKATTKVLTQNSCALAVMSPTTWIVCDTASGNISITNNAGAAWTVSPDNVSSATYNSSTGLVTLNLASTPAFPIAGSPIAGNLVKVVLTDTPYTVSSGTYNNSTGLVTLTLSPSPTFVTGTNATISLTGSGTNLGQLNGVFPATVSGSNITYTVAAGLNTGTGVTPISITGGTADVIANLNSSNILLASVSGSTITYTGQTGLGTLSSIGGQVFGTTWIVNPSGLTAGAFFTNGNMNNFHNICYDSVTLGKAYVMDSSGTIWVTANSGTSWSQASSTGALPSTNLGPMRLKSVVGKAGHLFWASGNNNFAPSHQPSPTTQPLYFSSDGGATWSQVTNANFAMTIPWSVGTTPPAPGQSYPSVAIYGWMKTASTGGLYVLDVWRCDNFNPASPGSASMVWTQMNWTGICQVSDIEGNPSVYNQWILSMGGNFGCAQGWNYYGPATLAI